MTSHWDEFSKSLAKTSVPRRESLRLLGATLAGAILSPFGVGGAFAGQSDPCKTFCKCRNKSQQSQCLAACRECDNDPRWLCGNCANGFACTDFVNDPVNVDDRVPMVVVGAGCVVDGAGSVVGGGGCVVGGDVGGGAVVLGGAVVGGGDVGGGGAVPGSCRNWLRATFQCVAR